jgi:hypothetical protein
MFVFVFVFVFEVMHGVTQNTTGAALCKAIVVAGVQRKFMSGQVWD